MQHAVDDVRAKPAKPEQHGTPHVDQSTLVLTPRVGAQEHDPIAFDVDGGVWFYDETWAYAHGPYADEAAAEQALRGYAATL
jgi:hypothetical protein